MIAPVFVDADVLVYARDANEAVKQPRAADWIARLWSERSGRTSMQVLSEYYATVTRKVRPAMSADTAWSDVRSYLAWQPQPIDRVLLQSVARGFQGHGGLGAKRQTDLTGLSKTCQNRRLR